MFTPVSASGEFVCDLIFLNWNKRKKLKKNAEQTEFI